MNKKIVFVTGPACSGKSTLVKIVNSFFDSRVVSSGDIVRKIAKDKNKTIDEICPPPTFLCKYENDVRTELVREIWRDEQNVLVDGFPRNIEQYIFIQKYFINDPKYVGYFIFINTNLEILYTRMMRRGRNNDHYGRILSDMEQLDELKDYVDSDIKIPNIKHGIV